MQRVTFQQKIRFFTTAILIYATMVIGLTYLAWPATPFDHNRPVALKINTGTQLKTNRQNGVVSGRPVRLVIPGSAIDIPIDPGSYDQASNTWTLSGYDAQYAVISVLANNSGGETFIYGHNNDFVFGSLRHNTPQPNAMALIYTDNGHIFTYSFQNETSLGPSDTEILNYNGPPILMLQTCTGSLDEWRTEFIFNLQKVV